MIEGLTRQQTHAVYREAGVQPAFWQEGYTLDWLLDKKGAVADLDAVRAFIADVQNPRAMSVGYIQLIGPDASMLPQLIVKELLHSSVHSRHYEASEVTRESLWDAERGILAEVSQLAFLSIEGLRPKWQPGQIPCRPDEMPIIRDFFKRQIFDNRAILYQGELSIEEPSWWGEGFDTHLKNCLTFKA